jgi:site-specific recombinase XerD
MPPDASELELVPRDPATAVGVDLARAATFVLAQHADATRRAYRTDWAIFRDWGAARGVAVLPAAPEIVAAFLAAEAERGVKAATLARRAAAIRYVHAAERLEPPTNAELVRATMRGIRRKIGTAPQPKAPLLAAQIVAMALACPESVAGLRDRALILLGFAGAFRRAELAALRVADLEEVPEGLRVTVRRSKGDPEGRGQVIPIVRGIQACPIAAVAAWRAAAEIGDGPLFRRIRKGAWVTPAALTAHSIAQIVKAAAARAGFDPTTIGGHSLRAGFVTSAAVAGRSLFRIMDVTRHRRVDTLRGYVRRAEEFRDHAGAGLL